MFILNGNPSIANQFLFELRDASAQKDRMRFRKNLQRLGEILAYEISKTLPYASKAAATPLGSAPVMMPQEQPVLITILRAGLPFFEGFLNVFDRSDSGFIGAFRKEDEHQMSIRLEYLATPDINNKIVVLIDPMLATGRSVVDSLKALKRNGTPQHLHVASLVAAPEGIEFLKREVKVPFSLWTCAVDEKLNSQYYIVPGLGDAGDLSYGDKL